jgi:tight adherence protein B
MQVQRRSGGDLSRVLRGVAGALEEERRVLDEGRAATAQARFTAAVVIALPVCGIALGALASPGLLARLTGSALGAGLRAAALLLQVTGALVIRRLATPFA